MKTKKIPLRTCCVTREKLEKQQLIRVVKTPLGDIKIDLSGKLNGRGVYFKKDVQVIDKAIKKNVLSRVFDTEVNPEIYEELKKMI